MQFVGGALQRSQVIAQGARNGVLERAFQRFLAFSQGDGYLLAIIETAEEGVNWDSSGAFLADAWPMRKFADVEVSLAFGARRSYLRNFEPARRTAQARATGNRRARRYSCLC